MLRDADGVIHTLHVYEAESVLPEGLMAELEAFLLIPNRELALERFRLVSCFLTEWRTWIFDGKSGLSSVGDVDCTEEFNLLDSQSQRMGSDCLSALLELSAESPQAELDLVEVIDEIVDEWRELYVRHATCLGHVLLEHISASAYAEMTHDVLLGAHARMHSSLGGDSCPGPYLT